MSNVFPLATESMPRARLLVHVTTTVLKDRVLREFTVLFKRYATRFYSFARSFSSRSNSVGGQKRKSTQRIRMGCDTRESDCSIKSAEHWLRLSVRNPQSILLVLSTNQILAYKSKSFQCHEFSSI